eukprot:GHVN01070144.1.p1 GENE.GHVN01070144.1~~GHVN01070144.1.p1  ORF type:complete len:437 (+),score=63.15 GHVN01070144.1:129-1439(+)
MSVSNPPITSRGDRIERDALGEPDVQRASTMVKSMVSLIGGYHHGEHHLGEELPFQTQEFVKGIPEVVSPTVMVISLVGAVIGNGIIALPTAFALTDITWGIAITLTSCFIAWASAIPIINCCKEMKVSTYDAIGERIPNKFLRIMLTDGALVADLVLAAAGYVVIVATSLKSFAIFTLGEAPNFTLLCVLSAFVMACLSLNRSYDGLRLANSFAFLTFLFVIGVISVKSLTTPMAVPPPNRPVVTWGSICIAFAQITTAYICQYNVPGLYAELQRKDKANAKCVFLSDTKDNSLMQLQEVRGGDVIIFITQMLLGAAILVTTPLVNFPLKMFALRMRGKDIVSCSKMENVGCTFFVVTCVLIVAIICPRLDLIMQIIGATAGNVVAFITPGVFSLCVERGVVARMRALFLITLGCAVFVICCGCIASREFALDWI